ncbi:putative membrane protein [Streptomyces scabiei 87.22]|uniref:Putative membrane protein n=1 Tax=Streptomyces scabiei (strain 87.22) TaxID=680198 RepID=C9Z927_STRSW|nr:MULTISPECIES: hypothetical protein [Streptomyces]MBP5875676.1 hypothetical protein [Streptomyces sp. LBUM 1477]MDX2652133.1 hypothetical protein [Streptomyces scabiei]MDX2725841.1 hypothetical protein [Streptomyces scabiei]MDX2863960.1 hypothetical protein [Streptomyces scabiei]MDX2881884.1 hypothetical protein [Streptomyces scabiei]
MMSTEIVTALVLGLVINEFCDVSPWLARKVIWLAARCVPDAEARQRLEEEWAAGIQDRPGKILKLLSALTLLASAMTSIRGMYLAGRPRFHHVRWIASALFDREGRIVMLTVTLSGVINTYANPWSDGRWSMLVTLSLLSVVINGADLWWRFRKARRGRSHSA